MVFCKSDEISQLGSVIVNKNSDVKEWVGLAYNHDKKYFGITLLHLLSLLKAFFKYYLLLFMVITHQIKSHKINFGKNFVFVQSMKRGTLIFDFTFKKNSNSCSTIMTGKQQFF